MELLPRGDSDGRSQTSDNQKSDSIKMKTRNTRIKDKIKKSSPRQIWKCPTCKYTSCATPKLKIGPSDKKVRNPRIKDKIKKQSIPRQIWNHPTYEYTKPQDIGSNKKQGAPHTAIYQNSKLRRQPKSGTASRH